MDRLTEMEAFATVVDQGGFTDAAKKMGISKSAVSKHVSSLEARLGAQLLNRTTRRVSPTEIGLTYYDRALSILNDAGEADAMVNAMHTEPQGTLRISVATDFGVMHMTPVLAGFLAEYPEVTINMVLSNRHVELISEVFDLAVRVGPVTDGSLVAHKLTQTVKRLVAAPSYLARWGWPVKIDDLSDHQLLRASSQGTRQFWSIKAPSGEMREIRTEGRLVVNDSQSLLAAVIAGTGIAYLPDYIYHGAMRNDQVVDVIPDLPAMTQDISAVYPRGRFEQPKVRAFVEHLVGAFAGGEEQKN